MPQFKWNPKTREKTSPKAFRVPGEKNLSGKVEKGGFMVYFGIEGASMGDSPGLLHKNAYLLYIFVLQYILIYKKDKTRLPLCIIEQVNMVSTYPVGRAVSVCYLKYIFYSISVYCHLSTHRR